jgi:hypothetical protein
MGAKSGSAFFTTRLTGLMLAMRVLSSVIIGVRYAITESRLALTHFIILAHTSRMFFLVRIASAFSSTSNSSRTLRAYLHLVANVVFACLRAARACLRTNLASLRRKEEILETSTGLPS